MRALMIAGVSLRRLFRDRSNIFWVVLAPLLFVFVLGLLFGGGQSLTLAVVAPDSPTAERITAALAANERIDIIRVDDEQDLRTEVERGMVHAGLMFDDDLPQRVATGDDSVVRFLTRPDDPFATDLAVWVRAVVEQEAQPLRAANVAAAAGAGSIADNLERARTIPVPGVAVDAQTVGEATFPEELSPFAPLAPSMLLLYVFLTSLTASLGLIEARKAGVTRRIFAAPVRPGTIVAGEALGRFGIALTQGLIVMAGSAVLFGVDWGDPLGAAALLVAFCLVGAGAGMLLGAVLNNEGAALGVAMGVGLGLAAVGGAMIPLETLGDTARSIARFTPHAWGYEGFAELVRHGGGLGEILPHLGVLAAMAAALFALGAWQLRQALTR